VNLVEHRSPTRQVFDTPTLLLEDSKVLIVYPRNFRLLRALAVSQWYFPEELHWRILLDLEEMSFNWLNRKQKLELHILISSRRNCEVYLYETKRYSGSEIFGNILGNDLRDLKKNLKIQRRKPKKPRRPVRRRGYKDHGARRPDDRWLPSNDVSLTEEQVRLEQETDHYTFVIARLLRYLENQRTRQEEYESDF
jgi:hypothetical protein